jgi:hypothetical protein
MRQALSLMLVSVIALGSTFTVTAQAKENTTVQEYQDQERWQQFQDDENRGFKVNRRPGASSAPVTRAPDPANEAGNYANSLNYNAPNNIGGGNFNVNGYMVDPNPPQYTPPTTIIQNETVPMVAPTWYPGWGYGNGWNHWGYRNGLAPYPVPGGRVFGLRTERKVLQLGPSKASGNYFSPSTADPTASGNYFAPTGPKVYPIIQNNNQQNGDYWGASGNPFQKQIQK